MTNYVMIVATIAFSIAQYLEQRQLPIKYMKAKRGMIAAGYNSAMKVMVANRLFIVIYFIGISFSIEQGIDSETLTLFLLTALFITASFNAFSTVRFARENQIPIRMSFSKLSTLNTLAISANLVGLTLPQLLGTMMPEYRLTLAQSSFLFNSVYTIINVYYIESKLAQVVDSNKDYKAIEQLFILRITAPLISAAALFSLYLSLRPVFNA